MDNPPFVLKMTCSCGRTRQFDIWPKFPRTYRCYCGATLTGEIEDHEQSGRDRCHVWRNGARCGEPVIPSIRDKFMRLPAAAGMMCQHCALAILNEALEHEPTRKYLRESLAREEVDRARQKIELNERLERKAKQERRAAKKAADDARKQVVYYVQNGHDQIKIGTTTRLADRMNELRVANRANLLAAEPGGRDVESQRHAQFEPFRWRKRKEDFRQGRELLEHIAAVRLEHGDPWHLPARLLAKDQGGDLQSV